MIVRNYIKLKNRNEQQRELALLNSHLFVVDLTWVLCIEDNTNILYLYNKLDSSRKYEIMSLLDIYNFYENSYRYIENIELLKNIDLPIVINKYLAEYFYLVSGKCNTDKITFKQRCDIERQLSKLALMGIFVVFNIDAVIIGYMKNDILNIICAADILIEFAAKEYLNRMDCKLYD